MTKPKVLHNSDCIKCNIVEKEMVIIGAVVMCKNCYTTEFESDDPVKEERDNYLYWLNETMNREE